MENSESPARTCAWCGDSIAHLSPRALYCKRQHKTNAGGKRHRERNPGYYDRYRKGGKVQPPPSGYLPEHESDIPDHGVPIVPGSGVWLAPWQPPDDSPGLVRTGELDLGNLAAPSPALDD